MKASKPLHQRLRSVLRQQWLWSPERREAKKRQWVGAGYYCCESCLTPHKKVEVDHIVPIGPTPGSRGAGPEVTWDGFIGRLFCPPEGLQILCTRCHARKTAAG